MSYSSPATKIIIFLGVFLFSTYVQAESSRSYNERNYASSRQQVKFTDEDKMVVQDYYTRLCEGRSKRNYKRAVNVECSAPLNTKKYSIGRNLPSDMTLYSLPRSLEENLSPAPRGYEYVLLEKDVLLISSASGKVMDAVPYQYNGTQTTAGLYPIKNSYVVYFDPQTATLGRGESRILDQIAREVAATKPRQVTVTSYADTLANTTSKPITDDKAQALFLALQAFGIATGNQSDASLATGLNNLAAQQEDVVSKALLKRNIANQSLDAKKRGPLESRLLSDDESGLKATQMVVVDLRN